MPTLDLLWGPKRYLNLQRLRKARLCIYCNAFVRRAARVIFFVIQNHEKNFLRKYFFFSFFRQKSRKRIFTVQNTYNSHPIFITNWWGRQKTPACFAKYNFLSQKSPKTAQKSQETAPNNNNNNNNNLYIWYTAFMRYKWRKQLKNLMASVVWTSLHRD